MAKITRMSLEGLAALVCHEGIVQMPYRDSVGVWTFGIGHTAAAGTPYPESMPRGTEKPLDYVMEVFARDIARYEADVAAAVKVDVKQHEFDALVSFHYNTGAIARATLTKELNAGHRDRAAAAFMNWVKPPEVRGRRQAERDLFLTGRYAPAVANVYPADMSGNVLWGKARKVAVRPLLETIRSPAPPLPPAKPETVPVAAQRGLWGALAAAGAAVAGWFADLPLPVVIVGCAAIAAIIILALHRWSK